ncbi:hypothetical protein [Mesorhizobium sp. M0768]|uniref:hypothetical protein n=1 Tax=Mesorhizobium sp. M0768 TaxID=2956996 RepID=UPI003337A337
MNGTAVMKCAIPMPLPVSLAFEKPWTIIPTVQALSALLFLGVMSTAVVYVVCYRLISLRGPAYVTMHHYLPQGQISSLLQYFMRETICFNQVIPMMPKR